MFTYDGGRLSTVQQVGLEDNGARRPIAARTSECRTWTYTWNGDYLEQLTYPDGTARKFYYEDTNLPGYMTRLELLNVGGTDSRVEAAWEYTAGGRIYRTWKGADTWSDTAAVEKYEFSSYDDESQPTAVDVTDPFGQVASYTIGYDTDSVKPRLESISGQCPSCGGPDDQYEYDPGQPLLPTARIDGDGHRTELTYNANGTVATRIEAAGTGEARTTTYGYDTTFPGLRTLEQRPSTDGSGYRETTWSYDGTSGVLLSRTISGDEPTYDADGDGIPEGSFTLTTDYSGHNAAGQPGTIDPPGGGTADATTFTYTVPGRNGLLAGSRTDPLVGTTTYGYDGLNRRSSVIDPNGVETARSTTGSTASSRSTRAASTTEALVTEYHYNAFGDLESVVDPKGHVTVVRLRRRRPADRDRAPGHRDPRRWRRADALHAQRLRPAHPRGGAGLGRLDLADEERHPVRLLLALLPRPGGPRPGRRCHGGHRIRLRLQPQPRRRLGRRAPVGLAPAEPGLRLRRAGPPAPSCASPGCRTPTAGASPRPPTAR